MLRLQDEYHNGTSWTNANYYKWNGGLYSGGYGCAGFSFMLSDAAFGNVPARKTHDTGDIKIGDILRVDGDSHSVIVIGYDKSGVIVAEGNFNYSVRWGRYIKFNEMSINYILTRY